MVPGIGKLENERSKPGYGQPGFGVAGAVVEQDADRRLRLERRLGEVVGRLLLDRVGRQRHRPVDPEDRLEGHAARWPGPAPIW